MDSSLGEYEKLLIVGVAISVAGLFVGSSTDGFSLQTGFGILLNLTGVAVILYVVYKQNKEGERSRDSGD